MGRIKIDILNIFFSFCLTIPSTTANANSQLFTIKVNNSEQTLGHETKTMQCALKCLSDHDCCIGYYDISVSSCKLDECCLYNSANNSKVVGLIKTKRLVDCSDIACGTQANGVYEIYPDGKTPKDVFCYFNGTGESWTVIQQRLYGDVDFYRNWEDYKVGFGTATTDHWIGNDIIHKLTNIRPYTLRFDMKDFAGNTAFAEYTTFIVENEAQKYQLTAEGYSGNAGDSLNASSGSMFSTFDSDNDGSPYHCANLWKSGWWFLRCGQCNPNGPFSQVEIVGEWWTMHWNKWRTQTQLKKIEMKIKPLF